MKLIEKRLYHGDSRTKLYAKWLQMMHRCYSTRHDRWKHYGGRGIMVFEPWHNYFQFKTWALSSGYSPTLSLDRIDTNKNYHPDNCHWIPIAAQSRNRNCNRYLTAFGETKIMEDWLNDPRCVISRTSLYRRINARWNPERAITFPTLKYRKGTLNA